MSSYQELKNQAQELLRQAEELRAEERARVLAEVREQVAEWNFSGSELGIKVAGKPAPKKVAPKYVHPVTGQTWGGRGKMSAWLANEIANGATKEQFLAA